MPAPLETRHRTSYHDRAKHNDTNEDSPYVLGRAAANLLHPFLLWMSRDPGHGHTATFQMKEEQHIIGRQSSPSEHLDCEEITTRQYIHVSGESNHRGGGGKNPPGLLYIFQTLGFQKAPRSQKKWYYSASTKPPKGTPPPGGGQGSALPVRSCPASGARLEQAPRTPACDRSHRSAIEAYRYVSDSDLDVEHRQRTNPGRTDASPTSAASADSDAINSPPV
jgi:hypothetical protein